MNAPRIKNSDTIYSQGKFDPAHPIVTQSWLKLHEACAFAAFLRYVQGEKDPLNGPAAVGLAVDAGITHGANSVISTRKDAKLSEKIEIAVSDFDRLARSARFFKDFSKVRAREVVAELTSLHHREVAPKLRPVATQVAIRVDFPSYSLAGKIDLVEIDHLISDHKTANQAGKHQVSLYAQASIYCLLYWHKYGVWPSLFRNYVLLKRKKDPVEVIEAEVSTHDQVVLQHRIRTALGEMRNSLKTGDWRIAEQDHWRCRDKGRWCPFFSECPKGKK